MSKPGRRGRGKRPRDEPPSLNLGTQDQSPVDYQTAPSLGSSEGPRGSNRTASSSLQRGVALEIVGEAPRQKVAIPALKLAGGHESQRHFKKGRTPHACDHCRKAKSGCSGDQPCVRCKAAKVACVYGDGKRDKERKRLTKLSKDATILNQHNNDICDALRRIRLDMEMPQEQMRLAIDQVLAMKLPDLSGNENQDPPLVSQQASPKHNYSSSDENPEDDAESTTSHDIMDVGDRATESNQSSSSVAWMAQSETRNQEGTRHATTPQDFSGTMTIVSYHTEDSDLNYCDTSNIQIFDWPDPNTADTLVQSYFEHIHPSAPLLDRSGFMEKYKNFPRGSNNLSQEDLIFLGTLNMVFATSSVFANLTKNQLEHHQYDHLHYLARAKILCLDGGLLYENARVSTTCALGLLCLYFIATCNLNRAFTFSALAIRHAIRLDLHLRSKAGVAQEYYKEHLARLWWSLYSLECSLNALTGRPSCISDRDISVSLPNNIDFDPMYTSHTVFERMDNLLGPRSHSAQSPRPSRGQSSTDFHVEQSASETAFTPSISITSSTYFIYRIQLCRISHDISTRLYCAATPINKWSDIQDLIQGVDQKLSSWRTTLPPDFSIDFSMWTEPNWNDPNVLSGMGLAMEICYSRIILFRPYLCRFDGRIKNLSNRNMDVDQEAVEICLKSAKEMIILLSAPARSVQTLYAITPWWNILHYLCEALSVLLLEMAFQSQHAPDQTTYTLEEAKKGIRWLSMMSDESTSARKAWEIYDRLVRHVAPMVSWSMFDLPASAPIPPGYRISGSNVPPTTHHDQYQHQVPENTGWQQEPHHDFASFDHNFTTGFSNMSQGRSMVSNPLDHRTALEKFETMVKLHGQYDEPWQQMFQFSTGVQGMGIMEQQQQQHDQSGLGESSSSQTQMPFDPRLGQFDSMAVLHEEFN